MTSRPRKALIIGAGIAGPVTAMFLTRAGIEAELYEAWPYSTGIGGGLQIAPNGMHVLAELGLADELIRNGSIAESFDFYSQSGKKLGSLNQNMQQRFGQPAVNMCRATLNETLIDKAWASNVSVFFEKRLVKIEDRGDQPVIAYFADGSTAEGDFVIGADGVHSVVRRHVIPDGPTPFDTGLIGFGGFVPRKVIEHLPIGRKVETTFGQSGFFGYGLCSPDPDAGAMWWSTQPSRGMTAAAYRLQSQDAIKQHLRDFHAGWHAPIPEIIAAAENIIMTDTLDVATLPTWSRKRTLLIGDAAHATSPNLGQGAAQALEDAYSLATQLAPLGDPDLPTLSAALGRYQQEREAAANAVVHRSRQIGQLGQAGGAVRLLRNIGMTLSPELARERIEAFYE